MIKMHKRIKEQIQKPKEKYCKKLPKTIEKQKEWQLHKIDFYTTLQLTHLLCLMIPIDGRLIREDEHSFQSKRLLSEIDPADLRIDFLKKEEMMDTIQPHTSPY